MTKCIVLFFMLFIGSHCYCQTLKEIFLALPAENFGLTSGQRDSLLNDFETNKMSSLQLGKSRHELTVYQPENRFLVVSAVENEMTHCLVYWNLSSTENLVSMTT